MSNHPTVSLSLVSVLGVLSLVLVLGGLCTPLQCFVSSTLACMAAMLYTTRSLCRIFISFVVLAEMLIIYFTEKNNKERIKMFVMLPSKESILSP